ncbi:hypothetical protein GC176_26395 [bacterium]|nr:hypothetical protein [bacterium]
MAAQLPVRREIQRALDILDDHGRRTEQLYDRRREHRRSPVNKPILVIPGGQQDRTPIEAWTCDVSRSGLSFICEMPLPLANILVCLDLDGESRIWMHASVKHCKEVVDGIYACGCQFQMRANSSV